MQKPLLKWIVHAILFSFFFSSLSYAGSQFVVWNVGQGQWTTWITDNFCAHFDMGGERVSLQKIARSCRDKTNFAYFSHWDIDHISFAVRAKALLKNLCTAFPPRGPGSKRKQEFLSALPACLPTEKPSGLKFIQELPFAPELERPLSGVTKGKLSSNDYSRVFVAATRVLVPGDSTLKEEKFWARFVPETVRYLVLGHHGSRTSTGEELLSRMPHLLLAIASSRKARFGHPHPQTLERLKAHHDPVISTEEWGNLWLELP